MKYAQLTNVAFLIPAGYFLWLGARGIVQKRAFVYSTRSLVWILLIIFVPPLFTTGGFPSTRLSDWLALSAPILMVALFAAVLWKQMSGYSFVGITEESFHKALMTTLQQLNLPFEESLSQIRLVASGIQLKINLSNRLGTAQMWVEQRQSRSILKEIAGAMRESFRAIPNGANMASFVFLSLLGLLMLASYVLLVISTLPTKP
jgi:hypothetical protein